MKFNHYTKNFHLTLKLSIFFLFFISLFLVSVFDFNTSDIIINKNINFNINPRLIEVATTTSTTSSTLNNSNINTINDTYSDYFDFEKFDNQIGHEDFIIPNVVHLIYLKTTELSFYQAINIYSIYLNQQPNIIFIHCENECTFNGYYWNQITLIKDLIARIRFKKISLRNTIFGQELKTTQQKLDILKILILMNYGGIYLDNSVYVVNKLDEFRKFEMVVSMEITPNERYRISTQVIIAHKNARFLKAWYDSYRTKFAEISFYSSGTVAGKIFKSNPYLTKVAKRNLGTANIAYELFKTYWSEWKTFSTLNLYLNQNIEEINSVPYVQKIQENTIQNLNCTFTYCEMCRDILKRVQILNDQ